jgi:hypothetical protein
MVSKKQMITGLIPYFMNNNPGKSADEIRSYLNQMNTADLENTFIHAVPLDQDTEAKIAAQAKLHADVTIKRLQRDQQYEQQARQKWPEMARQLGISNCDVNYNIAVSLHPSVFNVEDIGNMIMTGQLKFLPPSADELAERELADKHQIVDVVWTSLKGHIVRKIVGGTGPNDFDVFGQITYGETPQQNRARQIRGLLELPLDTLLQLHQRAAENQAVKSGQQLDRPPAEVDPNLNSGSGLDKANGGSYLPLPHKNQHGEEINAAYLVKLANRDMDLYKRLLRKHGYFHLTQRIRGLG